MGLVRCPVIATKGIEALRGETCCDDACHHRRDWANLKHSVVHSFMRTRWTKSAQAITKCIVVVLAVFAAVAKGQDGRPVQSPFQSTRTATPPVTVENSVPLIINTDLVALTITVTDPEGRHISGLDKSAFTIYDDKVPQQITYFSDLDAPVSLAIIFDTSKSMSGEKINRARQALARFIETTHREDEYFLISFSDRARLLLDKTRDAGAVVDKFTYMEPRGETALYDATYLGIEKVSRGSRARRAILLITDGNDTCSRYTLDEVRRSLQETDVVLYAIGILPYSRMEARAGRSTLKELASVSGGKAFFPKGTSETIEALDRIALELRYQYSIGYRPADLTAERKWHRVKVDVASKDGTRLLIRSRAGFYAPE